MQEQQASKPYEYPNDIWDDVFISKEPDKSKGQDNYTTIQKQERSKISKEAKVGVKDPKKKWKRVNRISSIYAFPIIAIAINAWLALYTYKLFNESQNTSHTELRAYVAETMLKIDTIVLNSKSKITLEYSNVGKTPAYYFRSEMIVMIDSLNKEERVLNACKLKLETLLKKESSFTLGIDRKDTDMMVTKPLDSVLYSILSNKIGQIYVIGRCEYIDFFGQKHFTNFFSKYESDINKFVGCKDYNDSN